MPPLTFHPLPVPLASDESGRVRVAGTRVPLERIVFAYNEGRSAAEIVASYPALDPGDLHAVICYYLRHRSEVDGYCAEVEKAADELEARARRDVDHLALRERLLRRASNA